MAGENFSTLRGSNFVPNQPTLVAPEPNNSQGQRGLRAALFNADANSAATDYYEALARGDAAGAKAHGLRAAQLSQQAQDTAPRVSSVGDIRSPTDVGDYLAAQAGGAGPGLVAPVAGGVAGAALGLRAGPRGAALGGLAGTLGAMYPDSRNAAVMQHFQAGDQQARPHHGQAA